MTTRAAAKRRPMAMPPRQEGFAVQPGGQLQAGWREGFAPVRPSKGVVIKAAWSWGAGDQFVAGVAPAEACKVFGKLGDALGSYRPDIELIWWFNYDLQELDARRGRARTRAAARQLGRPAHPRPLAAARHAGADAGRAAAGLCTARLAARVLEDERGRVSVCACLYGVS